MQYLVSAIQSKLRNRYKLLRVISKLMISTPYVMMMIVIMQRRELVCKCCISASSHPIGGLLGVYRNQHDTQMQH